MTLKKLETLKRIHAHPFAWWRFAVAIVAPVMVCFSVSDVEAQENVRRWPTAEAFQAGRTEYGTLPWKATEEQTLVFFEERGAELLSREEEVEGVIKLHFGGRFGIAVALLLSGELVSVSELEEWDESFDLGFITEAVSMTLGPPTSKTDSTAEWIAPNGASFSHKVVDAGDVLFIEETRRCACFLDAGRAVLATNFRAALPDLGAEWVVVQEGPNSRTTYDNSRVLEVDQGVRVWSRTDKFEDGEIASSMLDIVVRCTSQEMLVKGVVDLTTEADFRGEYIAAREASKWTRVMPESRGEHLVRAICDAT